MRQLSVWRQFVKGRACIEACASYTVPRRHVCGLILWRSDYCSVCLRTSLSAHVLTTVCICRLCNINGRVHNTHTHTYRYKRHGPPCVWGIVNGCPQNIPLAKSYLSRWASTHRLGSPRFTYSTVFMCETVLSMLLIHDGTIRDIHNGPWMRIMYSCTHTQEWSVSTAVGALAIPHPHQALLGFMSVEGSQQLKVRA